MSVVSGIVLINHLCENETEPFDEDAPCQNAKMIDEWLIVYARQTLGRRQEENSGGNKSPQFELHTAGINHLDEAAFVDFVLTLTWEWPDNFVLVVQPENGETRVYTGKDLKQNAGKAT